MILLIVLGSITFLYIGYYFMDKADKFIDNTFQISNDFSDGYVDTVYDKEKVILVYGDSKLTKLVKDYFDSQSYLYEVITDIDNISIKYRYVCLLALSSNDADNLMVSSISRKVYSIESIISLCNSQSNLKIFSEFNFTQVLINDGNVEKSLDTIQKFVTKCSQKPYLI